MRAGWIGALGAIAGTMLVAAPGASAQETTKLVTIAARECPSYTVIRGNRARNNIMESLKDLGPDTNYVAGEALTVEKEDAPPQDACKPITGWKFTLGTGYQSRAVTGPWGSLSKVTGEFSTSIVTEASVPQLNNLGVPVPGKSVAGAVTIPLTDAQADLAAQANRLWIQGGTPTDPVLNTAFPGQYGFGALRCAIDNLNGDNVEWISYPTGARHVFCYAYYVKPPPTSGTIIVRKEVDAAASQPSTSFRFVGNISFASDDSFTLSAAPGKPGAMTFYRAGGSSWNFTEQVPSGWQLTNITCSSAGGSTSTTDLSTGKTTVALVSGDTVTCTYTDRLRPPTAGLLITKITRGGLGTFGFSVDPVASGPTLSAKATTTVQGIAAPASPVFTDLAPGTYDIDEDAPSTDAGSWALERVTCNSTPRASRSTTQRITIAGGTGTICTFENRFTPNGTIRLRKVTRGGTTTTGFVINSVGVTPPRQYQQSATTTAENQSVLATGSNTSNLPLGTYDITELSSPSTPTEAWRLDTVVCNGDPVPAEQGSLRVTLTADQPDIDCTFTNVLDEAAVLPATAGSGDSQSTPIADLLVTKRASVRTIRLGETVRYTVRVTNRGPATAHNVVLAEARGDRQAIISATPARYRCSTKRKLPSCLIGTLRSGQSATISVLARPLSAGLAPNRAVVLSSTVERTLRNNVARAAVLVRPSARFTG